jgi:hypothetical protein
VDDAEAAALAARLTELTARLDAIQHEATAIVEHLTARLRQDREDVRPAREFPDTRLAPTRKV